MRLNKTYKHGKKRVFFCKDLDGKFSVWKGEGVSINEKLATYEKRFDAVCHAEAVLKEFEVTENWK